MAHGRWVMNKKGNELKSHQIPPLKLKTAVDPFMENISFLFFFKLCGQEVKNLPLQHFKWLLTSSDFYFSLFKIPSVVTQSFFPCWCLLLVFHVEMCLDRQWNITDQNDEWILMDSCKNTDNCLFCAAWAHYLQHTTSTESVCFSDISSLRQLLKIFQRSSKKSVESTVLTLLFYLLSITGHKTRLPS